MATLVWCKQQIAHLDQQQPALKASFSRFTRQARGDDKEECLELFGSVNEVQKFLIDPGNIDLLPVEVHNAPREEPIAQVAVPQQEDWFDDLQ